MLPDTVPFATSVTDPTRREKASLRGRTTDFTGHKEFHLIHQEGFFSVKAPLVEAPASSTSAVNTAQLTRSTLGLSPLTTHQECLDKLNRLVDAQPLLLLASEGLGECWISADPWLPDYIASSRYPLAAPDLSKISACLYGYIYCIREALPEHELPESLQTDVAEMLSLSVAAAVDDWAGQAETILDIARHAYHLVSQLLHLADHAEVLCYKIESGQIAEADIPKLAWDILEDVGLLMAEGQPPRPLPVL